MKPDKEIVIKKCRELGILFSDCVEAFTKQMKVADERAGKERKKSPMEYLSKDEALDVYNATKLIRPFITLSDRIQQHRDSIICLANDAAAYTANSPLFKTVSESFKRLREFSDHTCKHHPKNSCSREMAGKCFDEQCIDLLDREEVENDMVNIVNALMKATEK